MQTDLPIPHTGAIIDRALDCHESAVRLSDAPTIRQIERLIAKLPDASLCWQLGALLIDSPSGGSYRVTRAGCDCPNGRYCGARACWHIAAFELLLDMLETEVVTMDNDAEDRYNRGGW